MNPQGKLSVIDRLLREPVFFLSEEIVPENVFSAV